MNPEPQHQTQSLNPTFALRTQAMLLSMLRHAASLPEVKTSGGNQPLRQKTLYKILKQCKWTVTGTKNVSQIPLSVLFSVLWFGPGENQSDQCTQQVSDSWKSMFPTRDFPFLLTCVHLHLDINLLAAFLKPIFCLHFPASASFLKPLSDFFILEMQLNTKQFF